MLTPFQISLFLMTHPPTLDEVLRAIWKLKNGRAAGSDGIQPELLKYAEEPVSISLHTLFTRVWKTGLVPAEWHEGIIVSLYKGKGPHINCGRQRGFDSVLYNL